MNREESHGLADAYADDELDPLRSAAVEQHLRICKTCSVAYENLLTLKRSTSAAYFPLPDGLRESVLGAVRDTKSVATVAPQRDFRPWLLSGLAMAASLLIGFFLGQNLTRSSNQTLLAEITDNHIRSLFGTHLTDVASTNQHTVRPWFEGKIDFAPPVEDLSANGFPLVGGRVEYVSGRTVAALVYERRKHFINLFVAPASDGAKPVATTKPQRGYNILHWQAAGMEYWAVSEVSEDDLRKFASAFSGAANPSH